MYNDKKILAIIPARGGSKSIPLKNLALINGVPMISYTFLAAKESLYIDEIMVSTDSEKIREYAQQQGIQVPFMRPTELARDDTPMKPVIKHALLEMERYKKTTFDIIVLLQPTSPFRKAKHINKAIALFADKSAKSVVSVIEVPHQFSPNSLMKITSQGTVFPYEGFEKDLVLHRQTKTTLFARNGPAVLVLSRDLVLREKSFYTPETYPYIMGEEESVDIDKPFDLEIAEFLMRKRQET